MTPTSVLVEVLAWQDALLPLICDVMSIDISHYELLDWTLPFLIMLIQVTHQIAQSIIISIYCLDEANWAKRSAIRNINGATFSSMIQVKNNEAKAWQNGHKV